MMTHWKHLAMVLLIRPNYNVFMEREIRKSILNLSLYTVEPRYLELAYFELPLISKRKSGPCFDMKL